MTVPKLLALSDSRITWYDGVRFVAVSVGYPREWQRRARPPGVPRQILPVPVAERDPA